MGHSQTWMGVHRTCEAPVNGSRHRVAVVLLVGFASGCAASGVVVPNVPADELQRRLASVTHLTPPAYYLGGTYRGFAITDAGRDSAGWVVVFYGTCRTAEEGCGTPFQVQTR